MMKRILVAACLLASGQVWAQGEWNQKFEQLGSMLPSPNEYRTASGAPGVDYWQNEANYDIDVELNDETQVITGRETITYINNSPDVLDYLWVQLDQNVRAKDSNTPLATRSSMSDSVAGKSLLRITSDYEYDGGFKISAVTTTGGEPLRKMINKTMMRVDLPKALQPGEEYSFSIAWNYNINDRMLVGGRSGYEYFPKDGNYLYTIAQWFPRMAVYSDLEGWQNKQFLGRGEFTLPFGDYKVRITVPADHIVASTGTLQNPGDVLTEKELERFEEAKNSFDEPVMIVTQKEAEKKEKSKSRTKSTWEFHAEDVRDFAFASSRKFIWDGMSVKLSTTTPLAMSYYPKEGNPLWEERSTIAVVNTLKTYSSFTIDYPYPKAISVHAASIGMEYPMICFNFGRPNEDGTYSQRTLEGMVGVIVHEVGHNYFPMIINNDERQWMWMDEGINTFLEHMTLKEHYPDFSLTWGTPKGVVSYMKGDPESMRPIMTNPEQVLQGGYNGYGKPSAGLVMLRETIMGPELFDYAFKEYAKRWAFKHPYPADFFRTMEDASAVDLDWFWRGWFFSTDHTDIAIDNVAWYRMKTDDQAFENRVSAKSEKIGGSDSEQKASNFEEAAETFTFTGTSDQAYREFKNRVDDEAIKAANADKNFYEITFKNKGGLVMPLIIEWTYKDGTKEVEKLPAEIWRLNENEVTKVFAKSKEVVNIALDPNFETGDTDETDNVFPRQMTGSRFDKYKNSNR